MKNINGLFFERGDVSFKAQCNFRESVLTIKYFETGCSLTL